MLMNLFNAVNGWMEKLLNSKIAELDPEDDFGASSASGARTTQPLTPDTTGAQAPVPVPAQPGAPETTIVTGTFVPAGQSSASDLYTAAAAQTERFREIVDRFDEDRQGAVEWCVRQFASLFCYFVPFVVAGPVGLAIGDTFVSKSDTGIKSFAVYTLSLCLEILMPILGLAVTIVFKRALRDRSLIGGLVGLSAFFLAVSAGNAMVLFFLLTKDLNFAALALPIQIGIVVRSFGSLIIDMGSTVYLSVSGARSLAKYLADQQKKIVAIRDVNHINIELEQTQTRAAMERQAAVMDMDSKRKRQETWNEIERMQSQAMIEQARRNLLESGDRSSHYRRGSY